WKLDQVFDHATYNSALISNSAVLSGGTSISITVPPTVTIPDIGALDLDGVNGTVVISDAAELDIPPTAFSLAVWVRRTNTSTATFNAIYDSGTNTKKWWVFISDTSQGNKFGFGQRTVIDTFSTRAINDFDWHHLAVVVSGTSTNNVSFYVDGLAAGHATVSG